MVLSRRALLASAAALAALGGAAVAVGPLPSPAAGHEVLSDEEIVLVAALGDAMFPPGNPLGVAGASLPLAERVDELLGDTLDPMVAPVFRRVLQALDDGTLVSRGARFAALPLDARREVLAHWDDNDVLPRRAAFDALRLVMGMAYFTRPEVLASIGWRAPCARGTA